MSLILDALRKADRDRKTEADAPALEDIYLENPTARKPLKLWLFIGLAVIALLVIVVLIISTKSSERPVTLAANQKRPAAETSSRANSAITEKSDYAVSTKEDVEVKLKEEVKQAEKQPRLSASDLKKRLIQTQYQSLKTGEAGEIQPTISALYERPNNSDETHSFDTKPSSINETKSRSVAENSLANYEDIPTIKELPLSMQSTIPTLMYSQHSFEENGQSYIVLNGKQLSTGARASGLRVERILEDGVLLRLESENRKFKMTARSSWINY